MNDKEKHRFHSLSDKDKKRYDSEMANYKPKKGEGRKKKRTKDPNAPKRPLSAFFWFCNDERPKAKASLQDATVGEVAKELGRRWNECTEDQKSKYEALAAKDKARYEKVTSLLYFAIFYLLTNLFLFKQEIKAYKAGGGGVATGKGKAAAKAKKESSEEEEEEDDDDEDEDSD